MVNSVFNNYNISKDSIYTTKYLFDLHYKGFAGQGLQISS